jgi:uncharacterized protein
VERRLDPIELIVLQGTSFCNLDCAYCDLSRESRRTRQAMTPQLIERVFSELFTSGRLAPEVTVIWHSGEPLTLPVAYYDDAIERILRLKHRLVGDTVSVSFDIQTNGTLIDRTWCAFLQRHQRHLKIGVSCDGPAEMHDAFRRNWSGNPSHTKTLRGMELLSAHGIKYKVIAVVTENTLADPDGFFAFFAARRDSLSGFHFNILAGSGGSAGLSYRSEDRRRYYAFYRRLLELGLARSRDFRIQNFALGLDRILRAPDGAAPSWSEQSSAPLKSVSIDANGNVTTFYAGLSVDVLADEYGDGRGLSIGNILEMPFAEMVRSEKLRRIMQDFAASTAFCRDSCEYFGVCPGGFEITKRIAHGDFRAGETPECVVHVKALTDALLDDATRHLEVQGGAS